MTLEIAQRQIKLQWVLDYERVVAILSAQHGVQVTCTATSAIRDTTDIDSVIEIIDTLCDVMTVARGTLVSWTSFDVMVKDSKLPYSRYNSVTRPFVGIGLISSNECQNTKLFLERGFSRCQDISPDFQVRKIARSFTETRTGAFLESRALLIFLLVEYIATLSRLDERIYFLNNQIFKIQMGII